MMAASRAGSLMVLLALIVLAPSPGPTQPRRQLRVCADPNNLPFSNDRREGFENRIVDRLAREMDAAVAYVWWPQRRGFIRNTLNTGACDVVPGVPAGYDLVRTTRPYYRSTYVTVSRRTDRVRVASFDDPALRRLRIGVQLIGDDGVNTPPAHALARRGIVTNVRGYPVYGDYRTESPPARIVDAVARGDIDVAFVWGPLAGFFVARRPEQLELSMLDAREDPPNLSLVYAIAMGVRKDDEGLRGELDTLIQRLQPEIDTILDHYAVPRTSAQVEPR